MPSLSNRLRNRWVWLLTYMFFAAAGLGAIFIPPTSVREESSQIATLVWACFLLAGGLLGASDIITGRHFGEVTGLPLLAASVLILGVVLIYRTFTGDGTRGAAVVGCLACALFALLLARVVEVVRLIRTPRGTR